MAWSCVTPASPHSPQLEAKLSEGSGEVATGALESGGGSFVFIAKYALSLCSG